MGGRGTEGGTEHNDVEVLVPSSCGPAYSATGSSESTTPESQTATSATEEGQT